MLDTISILQIALTLRQAPISKGSLRDPTDRFGGAEFSMFSFWILTRVELEEDWLSSNSEVTAIVKRN